MPGRGAGRTWAALGCELQSAPRRARLLWVFAGRPRGGIFGVFLLSFEFRGSRPLAFTLKSDVLRVSLLKVTWQFFPLGGSRIGVAFLLSMTVLSSSLFIFMGDCYSVRSRGTGLTVPYVSWSQALCKLARDLLHPSLEEEKKKHKKKRLVQSPNSYFMDVKCPGCYKITTVFSHAQTVVLCVGCSTVLCQPTGGKARLTEGCSFRRKQH
ncbi:ribosomal protein eS27-like isoform X1 [Saccopteryx leptura]|uniref:ribosomal protein eS27-like isoform X1 n=1 Tax=Saccopteryx leptura TaxID=249018 RepID=UPI00339C8425